MEIMAIFLVVAGAFALAIYNILGKVLQRGKWSKRTALVAVAASSGASILLLGYSLATGGPRLSDNWVFPVVATGILNIGIMYAKLKARALEDVSLVSPIDSTTPAVVILTAMMIVGEFPTGMGWLGIWVLVLGTYILNIQELRQNRLRKNNGEPKWRQELKIWLSPFLMFGKSRGVRWAFLAVGLSTLSLPYDGLVARRVDVGFGFGMVFLIVAIGSILLMVVKREYPNKIKWNGFVARVILLGLTFGIATVLFGLAFQISMVAYVGTIKRITIPFTIILAYMFLGERKFFRQRIAGGVIMAIGATLIAIGG